MGISIQEVKILVTAAQRGERGAFERLVSSYERGIFMYLYGYVRQKEDAQDLAQEVFVRLYRNIDSADPDRGFTSWLYTMATNIMHDWFRKKKNRKELFLIDDESSDFETIDESATYEQLETTVEGLSQALDSLRPIYRSVITLFYYEEMSYEEIARVLALPLNTVKTYLYRAKKALKDSLTTTYGDFVSELLPDTQGKGK